MDKLGMDKPGLERFLELLNEGKIEISLSDLEGNVIRPKIFKEADEQRRLNALKALWNNE